MVAVAVAVAAHSTYTSCPEMEVSAGGKCIMAAGLRACVCVGPQCCEKESGGEERVLAVNDAMSGVVPQRWHVFVLMQCSVQY